MNNADIVTNYNDFYDKIKFFVFVGHSGTISS